MPSSEPQLVVGAVPKDADVARADRILGPALTAPLLGAILSADKCPSMPGRVRCFIHEDLTLR
jgi:hypothetical protein